MIPLDLESELAASELEAELTPFQEGLLKAGIGVAVPFHVPDDVIEAVVRTVAYGWLLTATMVHRVRATARRITSSSPGEWRRLIRSNRPAAIRQLAAWAAQQLGLRRKRGRTDWGDARRVQQYHRRQMQRGHVPGRSRQGRRWRELEAGLEQAASAMAGPC